MTKKLPPTLLDWVANVTDDLNHVILALSEADGGADGPFSGLFLREIAHWEDKISVIKDIGEVRAL